MSEPVKQLLYNDDDESALTHANFHWSARDSHLCDGLPATASLLFLVLTLAANRDPRTREWKVYGHDYECLGRLCGGRSARQIKRTVALLEQPAKDGGPAILMVTRQSDASGDLCNTYTLPAARMWGQGRLCFAAERLLTINSRKIKTDRMAVFTGRRRPKPIVADGAPVGPAARRPTDPIAEAADRAAIDAWDDPDDQDGPQLYRGLDGAVVDPSIFDEEDDEEKDQPADIKPASPAPAPAPAAKSALTATTDRPVDTSSFKAFSHLKMSFDETSRELAGLLLHETRRGKVTQRTLDAAARAMLPLVQEHTYKEIVLTMRYALAKPFWRKVILKSSETLDLCPVASFARNYDTIRAQCIQDAEIADRNALRDAAAAKARVQLSNPGYNPDVDDPNTAMGRLVLSLL